MQAELLHQGHGDSQGALVSVGFQDMPLWIPGADFEVWGIRAGGICKCWGAKGSHRCWDSKAGFRQQQGRLVAAGGGHSAPCLPLRSKEDPWSCKGSCHRGPELRGPMIVISRSRKDLS